MSRALQWKLIVGFLLVFIAGGVTGAFFGASYAHQMFFQSRHHGMMADRIRQRLRKELDLTPEQLTKISPIIDKEAGQLEQIRQETGQRVHGIIADAHQQIATNLTDEQRTKLKDFEARMRQRHERRRDSHRWHSSDAGMSQ